MSTEPFVAEIMIFTGNFAPKGWAFCNGQLISIAQNTALFALLGTTYGGNGQTTFALPNLQDRAPLHAGQGPGLSSRDLGEVSGVAEVTLLPSELPAHTHALLGVNGPGNATTPAGNVFAADAAESITPFAPGPANATMGATAVSSVGGGQPHNNLPPYLALNYIIALQGVFPPRN